MAKNTEQLAVAYAALILYDAGKPVTADAINKVLQASGTKVPPIYASLYENFIKKNPLKGLLSGAGAPAAAAPAPAAAAAAAAPAAAAPGKAAPAAKKAKAPEPDDDDDGPSLF